MGIWCSVQPAKCSRKVGFELLGGSGQSVFLVVYGGREFTIELRFLMPRLGNAKCEIAAGEVERLKLVTRVASTGVNVR